MELGNFSLVAAWLLSLYGLFIGLIGAWKKKPKLSRSAANSIYVICLLSVVSLISLGIAFVQHDYRYVYVWQTSNNEMHTVYLVSAIWGGMDGSMLLWAAIMSIFAALVVWRGDRVERELMNWVVPILSGATSFFLFVVSFLTNPFRLIPPGNVPLDGTGLNPLLQNPSMAIHPPCLYIGFTGFVVPFAFCLAALLSGSLSDSWTRVTRRWTLVAWGFLTAGVILGGNWAYIELGWGGFWGWDPVENSSFMPWLTGTAYLHSVMVQQRRGMLKIWNVSLSVLTYSLTVFGTFLTRSGIVQSVHAFAETDIGWVFLAYLGFILLLTALLVIYRWHELRPENTIESYFSREAAFLFNNLAFLGICFATFWGVMFPVFSEAITGTKSVVGPPFFNKVNVPLFLVLIFLMGVGPLIAWRRASKKALIKVFGKPLIIGSCLTLLFLFIDPSRVGAAVAFGLCLFVLLAIEGEFRRAGQVRRQLTDETKGLSMINAIRRKPRKFGGLIVHIGVAVMTVSITASMVYKVEKDFSLRVGEQYSVGRFKLELKSLEQESLANYNVLRAEMAVFRDNGNVRLGTLFPEKRIYKTSGETTTEVDIRITPREDLYLAFAGLEASEDDAELSLEQIPAAFKVFVNPLQVWLWFGSLIVLIGTVLVIGPPEKSALAESESAGATVRA